MEIRDSAMWQVGRFHITPKCLSEHYTLRALLVAIGSYPS